MFKWNIKQVALQKLLHLERGNVSEYIKKNITPKVPTLLLLEELTGITVYRWMNSRLTLYDLPEHPLENYTPEVGEPGVSYGPNVTNTPLPALLERINKRVDTLESEIADLKKNCQ